MGYLFICALYLVVISVVVLASGLFSLFSNISRLLKRAHWSLNLLGMLVHILWSVDEHLRWVVHRFHQPSKFVVVLPSEVATFYGLIFQSAV